MPLTTSSLNSDAKIILQGSGYRVVSTKFSMQIEVLSVKRDLATIMKDAEIFIYVLGVKGIVQE